MSQFQSEVSGLMLFYNMCQKTGEKGGDASNTILYNSDNCSAYQFIAGFDGCKEADLL